MKQVYDWKSYSMPVEVSAKEIRHAMKDSGYCSMKAYLNALARKLGMTWRWGKPCQKEEPR